jgi:outer membrane murein-binding lipoprotein Lpp
MLAGMLLAGCGGSAEEAASGDAQEAFEQNVEEFDQQAEELEQETEALEQELEAQEQAAATQEQQARAQSPFVGVWDVVYIYNGEEWFDLSETELQSEYHLNADGTALVMTTGFADIETTWEEHNGTIVIKSPPGKEPDLPGSINGYGQLILENESENTTFTLEKR